VTRKPDAEAKAQADAKAKQQAERQRQLAKAFNNAVDQIGSGLSGEVSVKFNNGPGPAGVSYANFLQAVKSAYMRALVTPDNLNDENAVTVASVTIARDGTVVSARIVHLSGDDQLDRAVQRTLDRVKYAAPLPDSATEDQRTVEINFNAKAKRGFG
jgi:colicin import membrane protein